MIVAEMREGPIAQYMMAEKAIYVAAANRERAAQHLGARVNGRTWSWQARDGEKQAEEREYRPYDPTRDPQIGDVKVSEWECNTVVAAGDAIQSRAQGSGPSAPTLRAVFASVIVSGFARRFLTCSAIVMSSAMRRARSPQGSASWLGGRAWIYECINQIVEGNHGASE